MHADVQSLLSGDLGEWLSQQQAMREAATKKAHNRWFYAGIAALPVIAFILFIPFDIGMFRFFLSGFIGFGVFAWGYAPINEAKKTIKIGINSAIARSLGVFYEHDVVPGAEFDAARHYGLLPSFQRSNYEDRWFGELEGHPFNLYEAHLEQRRGSGKNRRWVTVFRGAILDMGFGRNFHSTTLLQRKGKHKKWFGLGGRADHADFGGHRLDYVDQVHPDFEGVFEVWSDDQVEARVLIHPTYVEHLLELERVFNGDAVRALFRSGEVIIAIESGNMFESGSMKAEEDAEHAAKTAEQFAAMARLATAINQNERGRVLSKEADRRAGAAPAPSATEPHPRGKTDFGRGEL